MKCDSCTEKTCYQGRDCQEGREEYRTCYTEADKKIHRVSTAIEGTFYMQKTRVEELIIFCREMDMKKIGVAFCVGLAEEARVLCSYLRRHFSVSSVCCKVCGVAKEDFSLPKINDERYEAMCNPLMQARVLEEENTELNLLVGLCIGHDILFNTYSHAPVTTLIVKDRVLTHNPAGTLYSRYYKNKLSNTTDVDRPDYGPFSGETPPGTKNDR